MSFSSTPFGLLDPNGCGANVERGQYEFIVRSVKPIKPNTRRRDDDDEDERARVNVKLEIAEGSHRGTVVAKKLYVSYAFNPFKKKWPPWVAFLSATTGINVRDGGRLHALSEADLVGKRVRGTIDLDEGVLKVVSFTPAIARAQAAPAREVAPPQPQRTRNAGGAPVGVDPLAELPLPDKRKIVAAARGIANVDVEDEPGRTALKMAAFRVAGKWTIGHEHVDALIADIREHKLHEATAA